MRGRVVAVAGRPEKATTSTAKMTPAELLMSMRMAMPSRLQQQVMLLRLMVTLPLSLWRLPRCSSSSPESTAACWWQRSESPRQSDARMSRDRRMMD